MATKIESGSATGVFQRREESRGMATLYRQNHIGQFGINQGQVQQSNNCAQAPEVRPTYVDIPFFMGGIERGKQHTVEVNGARVLEEIREAEPREFVFSGSNNLWLMPGSHANGHRLVRSPLPLDTFRPGGSNKVSWPQVTVYSSIVLVIENRCPARNGGSSQFIARLSCVAVPEAPF